MRDTTRRLMVRPSIDAVYTQSITTWPQKGPYARVESALHDLDAIRVARLVGDRLQHVLVEKEARVGVSVGALAAL